MCNDQGGPPERDADALTSVEDAPAMTAQRLDECLRILKWTPTRMAHWLECDVKIVRRWLHRDRPHQPIPGPVAAWVDRWASKSLEDPPPPKWQWKRPGY